jgi:hypothetical protein
LPCQQHPPHAGGLNASALSDGGNLAEHMVPAYGAGMTLEKGDLRCVIADPVRLIGILKIFVSKYQNQKLPRNRRRQSG